MMASLMEGQMNLVIHSAGKWAILKQMETQMVVHLEFLTRKGSWMAVCLAGMMVVTLANRIQKDSPRADY